MPKRSLLAKHAQAARDRRIEILKACKCTWPIRESRTASGHALACPAHAVWKQQFGDENA